MLIHCKICQREFDWDPLQKLRQQAWRGLCPDCLFLCKQQRQPAGPEKMILRILHEHLMKRHSVDEKLFIDWKNMPDLAKNGIPKFWSESIFGDFLECRYNVHYICGGNKEQVVDFGQKLQAAFDEKSRCFLSLQEKKGRPPAATLYALYFWEIITVPECKIYPFLKWCIISRAGKKCWTFRKKRCRPGMGRG